MAVRNPRTRVGAVCNVRTRSRQVACKSMASRASRPSPRPASAAAVPCARRVPVVPERLGAAWGGVGLQGFGGRGSRGLASTSATPPATSTARRLREVRFVITDGRWSRGRNVPHCQRRAGGAGSLGGRPSNSSGDGRINRMRIRGAAEACRCAPLRGSA